MAEKSKISSVLWAFLIASGLGILIYGGIKLTRGLRNNNPGNVIKTDTVWQGMENVPQTDEKFVVFSDPFYGIRVIAYILTKYILQDGLNNVFKIINTYAPPTENQTTDYVLFVANWIHKEPDEFVTTDDILQITYAIIAYENSNINPYSDTLIASAVTAGINDKKARLG